MNTHQDMGRSRASSPSSSLPSVNGPAADHGGKRGPAGVRLEDSGAAAGGACATEPGAFADAFAAAAASAGGPS